LFHPLRGIPGPLVAALTPYYLALSNFHGNRVKLVHRLHEKYGRVVRIAPNELSFSDKSVIQQLYSQTTDFMKSPRYDNYTIPPISIFVMRNKQQVRERRRYLSSVFSWSYLQKTEPVIHQNLQLLIEVIDQSIGKPFPVLYWFRQLALNING
jgi:benzoate 4-monooxygenase